MTITRENMIDLLAEKSGYWKKDVKKLLQCMDEVVFEQLCEVDDGNDVSIQLVRGIKVSTHLVPYRERINPKTQQPIVCKPTVKPMCKFSEDIRAKLQEDYDEKHNG